MVEYDKVHYPLPLNFEENPDVKKLKVYKFFYKA